MIGLMIRTASRSVNVLLGPEFWLGSSIHLTVGPQNASLISREQPCRCLSTTQPRDATGSVYHGGSTMADIHTRWKPDFDVYDRL